MMRKKTSSQLSPSCMRDAATARASFSALPTVANRSTPAWRSNASATVSRSGSARGIAAMLVPAQLARRRSSASSAAQSCHDRLVAHAGAIPFQHGELGMMQRRALGVAEHARELEQFRNAAGQQLLHRELGRAVQPALALLAVGQLPVGGEAREMHFGAGRDLQDRRLDLDEALAREPLPHRRLQARACLQMRQAPARACRDATRSCRPSHAAAAPCRVAGMTPKQIDTFCGKLPAATRTVQWEGVIVFKVGGKMFCLIAPDGSFGRPHLLQVGARALRGAQPLAGLPAGALPRARQVGGARRSRGPDAPPRSRPTSSAPTP